MTKRRYVVGFEKPMDTFRRHNLYDTLLFHRAIQASSNLQHSLDF